ncbi:MAG: AbrB/MazE/SpoVT family DNA-binding domain-containing protein [Candidatus Omnitrophica bacterium]|nr:AbrB/MazE/SpoVT family DNA-binding domain-containing protein [Candidatus Omnitrophota bacterium]MDD5566278.1 AbrB/MazE/SpoVT family DNA-binding domain-containing protein [Candidatus Omnitrophota bacterium]
MRSKSKIYGAVTVGKRGQAVIPAKLRKSFNIKPKDRLMVFAELDKKIISLVPEKYFSRFLEKAGDKIYRGL